MQRLPWTKPESQCLNVLERACPFQLGQEDGSVEGRGKLHSSLHSKNEPFLEKGDLPFERGRPHIPVAWKPLSLALPLGVGAGS